MKNGLWIALFLSLPAVFFLIHMGKIFLYFHQAKSLVILTQNYFFYAALSMPSLLLVNCITQILIALGKLKVILIMSGFTLPLTLFLSYALILGKFGFPILQLAGISCAHFLSQTMICFIILIYLIFNNAYKPYQIFYGEIFPNWNELKNILRLGLPIGLQFGLELGAITCTTFFMGYFGINALAATQITSQYAMLMTVFNLSISQATAILISSAYSNKNIILIKNYLHAALIFLLIFFTLISILFFLYKNYFLSLFLASGNSGNFFLIHLSKIFLILAICLQFIEGIKNILSGGLRACKYSSHVMFTGVICLWGISVPLSYLIGVYWHQGPVALRSTFLSGFIVAIFCLCYQFKKLIQKNMF